MALFSATNVFSICALCSTRRQARECRIGFKIVFVGCNWSVGFLYKFLSCAYSYPLVPSGSYNSCIAIRLKYAYFCLPRRCKHLTITGVAIKNCEEMMKSNLFANCVFAVCLLTGIMLVQSQFSNVYAAAENSATDKILAEAWTAYNIGNYKKTISLVEPLAGDGNPRAQVMLGRCYENGLGVEQDMAVAAQWFQLAAEQNDSEAQVLLAYCYEVGAGVPKNPREVMNLMTRAAESGNAEAQFNLALNYSQGLYGAPKNELESFRWASLAAQKGYAQAERFLGACYEYGFGVNADPVLSAEWYKKAAAQGLERDGSIFNFVRQYNMD